MRRRNDQLCPRLPLCMHLHRPHLPAPTRARSHIQPVPGPSRACRHGITLSMAMCSTMKAVHWYPRTRVLPQAWLCSSSQAALVPSETAAFTLASPDRYDHSLCEHCPYDHRAQRSNGGPIALSHPSPKRLRRSSVSQAIQIKASSTVSWHTPSAPWGVQRSISPWSRREAWTSTGMCRSLLTIMPRCVMSLSPLHCREIGCWCVSGSIPSSRPDLRSHPIYNEKGRGTSAQASSSRKKQVE
jgi:hypothetical protein